MESCKATISSTASKCRKCERQLERLVNGSIYSSIYKNCLKEPLYFVPYSHSQQYSLQIDSRVLEDKHVSATKFTR
jgi:hypothetical protein